MRLLGFQRVEVEPQPLPHLWRKSEFGQPQREMSATEWRKLVAHGVSRGEPCALAKRPVRDDRAGSRRTFFRRFAAPILKYPNPRLTPWATLLPLLRSFLPQLSKTDLLPNT